MDACIYAPPTILHLVTWEKRKREYVVVVCKARHSKPLLFHVEVNEQFPHWSAIRDLPMEQNLIIQIINAKRLVLYFRPSSPAVQRKTISFSVMMTIFFLQTNIIFISYKLNFISPFQCRKCRGIKELNMSTSCSCAGEFRTLTPRDGLRQVRYFTSRL